jgi:cysteine desulfuration protein SufE
VKEFQDMFEDLFIFDDVMDKYDYIMDYGNSATSVQDFNYTNEDLVQGCTSSLWIKLVDNKFICQADSTIVKGLGGMICDWYNQATPIQKQDFSLSTLQNIGLAPILSMGRQNGVSNLIKTLKYLESK